MAAARYQVERARLEASKQAIVSVIQGEESKIDLSSAEEKLRQEERELRRITDAIPQAIVVLDRSGMPMYANQATLDYTD